MMVSMRDQDYIAELAVAAKTGATKERARIRKAQTARLSVLRRCIGRWQELFGEGEGSQHFALIEDHAEAAIEAVERATRPAKAAKRKGTGR